MRIRIGVSLFFALIAGIGVSSQWKQWILFTHYQSFGQVDPQHVLALPTHLGAGCGQPANADR